MGAQVFKSLVSLKAGQTLEQCFHASVSAAEYNYGHNGYTGTIAEKETFTLIEPTAADYNEADRRAQRLIDDDDVRISDKWGPAGAILIADGTVLFFGWASD